MKAKRERERRVTGEKGRGRKSLEIEKGGGNPKNGSEERD